MFLWTGAVSTEGPRVSMEWKENSIEVDFYIEDESEVNFAVDKNPGETINQASNFICQPKIIRLLKGVTWF